MLNGIKIADIRGVRFSFQKAIISKKNIIIVRIKYTTLGIVIKKLSGLGNGL